jgi:hypothetical protein
VVFARCLHGSPKTTSPERGVVMLAAILFFVLAPIAFFLLTRSVD